MDTIDLTLPAFLRAENRDQPAKARTRQANPTRVTHNSDGKKSKRQRAKKLAKTGAATTVNGGKDIGA